LELNKHSGAIEGLWVILQNVGRWKTSSVPELSKGRSLDMALFIFPYSTPYFLNCLVSLSGR